MNLNTHSCAKVVGKQAFGTRAPKQITTEHYDNSHTTIFQTNIENTPIPVCIYSLHIKLIMLMAHVFNLVLFLITETLAYT